MFLTIKMYLHLNCMLMLNWIVWNGTVFDFETLLILNWIVIYRTVLIFNCVYKNIYLYQTELAEVELFD